MAKKMKIVSGVVKGTIGCLTFAGSLLLNGWFKAATGGFGAPRGSGTAVDDTRELSKYWFSEAKRDFDEAKDS